MDDETRRILLVVQFAAQSGRPLTTLDVESFAKAPRREVRRTPFLPTTGMFRDTVTTEPVWGYITRARLVDVTDGRVTVTRLGKVVLDAAEEREFLATQPEDVLLSADDEWALGDVLRVVRAAGPCLFVDPYCKEPQLNELARHTETARVLIGTRVASEPFDLTLENIRAPRSLELRISPNIHDRYVIPDDAQVLVLGTSLTGTGKSKPSVLVHLGDALSGTIRQVHEELWTRATVWAPPPPP